MNLEKFIKKQKRLSKQWNDKNMLEFARVASAGSYGDYRGCKSLESKLKKYKLMSEDLNKHRQVKDSVYIEDYMKNSEIPNLTKVMFYLVDRNPNDTDLGKEVRKVVLSWKEE